MLQSLPLREDLSAADFPYRHHVEGWPESGCHLLVETTMWHGVCSGHVDDGLEGSDIGWEDGNSKLYQAVVLMDGAVIVRPASMCCLPECLYACMPACRLEHPACN